MFSIPAELHESVLYIRDIVSVNILFSSCWKEARFDTLSDMSKTQNRHINPAVKVKAYDLYMTTDKKCSEIAKEAGTPLNTLKNWMRVERWNDKRIAMINRGMSRIDQKLSANQEVSIDNHRRELDALAEAVGKLRGKLKDTESIKELTALVNAIKSSHAVSKTLIVQRRQDSNRQQHHDDIPKNPMFFQLNVQPIPDRTHNSGNKPIECHDFSDVPTPASPADEEAF